MSDSAPVAVHICDARRHLALMFGSDTSSASLSSTSGARLHSRRSVLGLSAAALAGLSACSVQTGAGSDTGSGADAAAESMEFTFDPETTESTQLTWMDSGDLKALFIGAVIDEFGKQFPDIQTQYDGSGWDQVNQVVPLGIRNGTAPDVFALPQNVPAQSAINEGWVQPLEGLIPDFEAFRGAFPDTALINGIHVFDNQVYSWPLNSTRRADVTLYVAHAAAEKAGISVPVEEVATWDDLRAMAKEITASGTPGILTTADHLSIVIGYLANSAGWLGNAEGMNMKTGKYEYSAPEILESLQFIQTLIDDGSVVPGYLTLKDADARAQFPTGLAGISLNGPWDLAQWAQENPDFEVSILPLPSPDGAKYTIPFQERGANMTWVYKETANPDAVGAVLEYMGSVPGQTAMVELSQGLLRSTIDEANQAADTSKLLPNAKTVGDLADEYMRACPQFEIRNPEASAVRLALKPVNPDFKTTIQGIVTGQITDAEKALRDLDAGLNSAMEQAFSEAKQNGADVDYAELQFPNWDPSKDYTAADYDAL